MKKRLMALVLCIALLMGLSSVALGEATEPMKLTITMFTWQYTDGPESQIGQAWKALMEEKLGRELDIEWTFIPVGEYDEKSQIMVNTNTLTDIVLLRGGAFSAERVIELGRDGMFACLSDYDMPNLDAYYAKAGDAAIPFLDEEGKRYMVARLVDNSVYGAASMEWGSAIRSDVLKENNLEVPKTFDDLLDVARKLKEIYPDSTPIVDAYGFNKDWCGFAKNFRTGYTYFFTTDEMKYVYAPITENYRAYMTFLNEAYESDLIPKDYAAWKSANCQAAVLNDQAFIMSHCVGNIFNESTAWGDYEWTILSAGLHDPEIGVPFAIGGHQGTAYTMENWAELVVNANSPRLEDAIAFVDAYYAEDVQTLLGWGIEGVSYVVNEDGSKSLTPEYATSMSIDGQDTPFTTLGLSDQRPAGLWLNTKINALQQANWPEYDILQADGTIVRANQKLYAVENVKAGYNCNEVDQTLPALSPEKAEEYAEIMAAVDTYVTECRAKFITGEMDIETEWDAYVAKCYELGNVDAAIQLYNDTIADMELSY